MKSNKYIKLSSIIIASSVLLSGMTTALLYKNPQQLNHKPPLNWSNNLQATNGQIGADGTFDYFASDSSDSLFSIARDSVKGDRLYAWGDNTTGQLGIGSNAVTSVKSPVQVTGLPANKRITHIVTGSNYSLIIFNKREVWAAGANNKGQFGNKTTSTGYAPGFVSSYTFANDISSIDAGFEFTAAVSNGKIYTWGNNDYGQLGFGDNNGRSAPTEVTTNIAGRVFNIINCGVGSVITQTTSASTNEVYVWGRNTYGQLGLGDATDRKVPTLSTFAFAGKVTLLQITTQSSFVVTLDNTSVKLYSWGFDGGFQLGDGNRSGGLTPFQITWDPALTISKIVGNDSVTNILTNTGLVYVSGYSTNNGTGSNRTEFTNLSIAKTNDVFTTFSSASLAATDNGLTNWGDNRSAAYGDGSTTSTTKPAPAESFRKPSILVQNKQANTRWASTVANEIYTSKNGLNHAAFIEYVDSTRFPAANIFTTNSAPVVDSNNGWIQIPVIASQYFADPDGTKQIASRSFQITLVGFSTLKNSTIVNKAIAADTKHNLSNIITNMKTNGNDANMTTFNEFFTTTNFPAGNKFTINNDKLTDAIYTANIVATKSNKDGAELVNQIFPITITGLKAQPDSTITVKPKLNQIFNKRSISKLINHTNNYLPDQKNLALLVDIQNFPNGFDSFTIYKETLIDDTYTLQLGASKAYVAGNLQSTVDFTIVVKGLGDQPDSTITSKETVDRKFNGNNIVRLINPFGNGLVNLYYLSLLYDVANFPIGYDTFIVSNDRVVNGVYTANIKNAATFVDGFIVSDKSFPITVAGLETRVDSTIISLSPSFDEFDSIVSTLQSKTSNITDAVRKLIDINEFPADTKFKIHTLAVDKQNQSLHFVFTPSKVYRNGDVVENNDLRQQQFSANVTFTDGTNWGLVIGLSVTGSVLLLIIIGLVLLYVKRRIY